MSKTLLIGQLLAMSLISGMGGHGPFGSQPVYNCRRKRVYQTPDVPRADADHIAAAIAKRNRKAKRKQQNKTS